MMGSAGSLDNFLVFCHGYILHYREKPKILRLLTGGTHFCHWFSGQSCFIGQVENKLLGESK